MEATNCTVDPTMEATNGPSVDFIHAISEFLDTDPTDLLVELGYYESSPLAELPAGDLALSSK